MSKPDIMWMTARQALVFHRGRIWSMSQEADTPIWLVHKSAALRGECLTHFGELMGRFPGGYHAALDWIQKWLPEAKAA